MDAPNTPVTKLPLLLQWQVVGDLLHGLRMGSPPHHMCTLQYHVTIQKRPDLHKIVLSIKSRFPPPPPAARENVSILRILYKFFLILGPFRGGGKTKFCREEFHGHPDFSEQLRSLGTNPISGKTLTERLEQCETTTPGAIPGVDGNPHERFSFAPAFLERFFKNWGGPRASEQWNSVIDWERSFFHRKELYSSKGTCPKKAAALHL